MQYVQDIQAVFDPGNIVFFFWAMIKARGGAGQRFFL